MPDAVQQPRSDTGATILVGVVNLKAVYNQAEDPHPSILHAIIFKTCSFIAPDVAQALESTQTLGNYTIVVDNISPTSRNNDQISDTLVIELATPRIFVKGQTPDDQIIWKCATQPRSLIRHYSRALPDSKAISGVGCDSIFRFRHKCSLSR